MFWEILLITIAVVILGCLFFYSSKTIFAPNFLPMKTGNVCVNENCFTVEIAETEAQRTKGLMNRSKLDEDKGMLFIFNKEGVYPFWMKNTLIPLDIIWIDNNYKVVFIGKNVQPCKSLICPTTKPLVKAKYVLEINAGISDKLGIKVGDILNIK